MSLAVLQGKFWLEGKLCRRGKRSARLRPMDTARANTHRPAAGTPSRTSSASRAPSSSGSGGMASSAVLSGAMTPPTVYSASC